MLRWLSACTSLCVAIGAASLAWSQPAIELQPDQFLICELVNPLDRPRGQQQEAPDWWTPLYPDEVYEDLAEQCWALLGPDLRNDGPVLEIVRIWQAMNQKEAKAFQAARTEYEGVEPGK